MSRNAIQTLTPYIHNAAKNKRPRNEALVPEYKCVCTVRVIDHKRFKLINPSCRVCWPAMSRAYEQKATNFEPHR